MEDVLAVYTRPHDPDYPLVCLDETQATPRRDARADPYENRGARRVSITSTSATAPANLFMMFASARGLAPCQSHRSPHRRGIRSRLERLGRSPLRERQKPSFWSRTNLNIHSKASLYEAFPATEARRLSSASNGTTPPKHGSWLDLAEVRTRCSILPVPRPQDSRQNSAHREVAPHGSTTEMQTRKRPTGNSQPPMHAPNSGTFTLNLTDGRLVVNAAFVGSRHTLRPSPSASPWPGG